MGSSTLDGRATIQTTTSRRSAALLCCACLVAAIGCSSRADAIYQRSPALAYGERPVSTAALSEEAAHTELLSGLAEILEYQLSASPELRAARARYLAAVERVPAASRIPDLMVEYAYLPAPVETRVGPNEHRIMVKQAIPFPSKLVARDALARVDARRAAIEFDRSVRDAVTASKVAYADLVYIERALVALDNNRALAQALADLGASANAGGTGTLFDVARAQAQLAQLDYDKITFDERRTVALAQINALLGRPADAPLQARELPTISVGLTEDALVAAAFEHRQELALLDEGVAGAEARSDLAASGWAPDLTIGAQLMLQGESTAASPPPDSGDEALALTLGLSLPVWGWADASESAAAEAELEAAIYQKEAALYGVQAQVREALVRERNAERLRVLYESELLPHAAAALEAAEQASQADRGAYADALEARAAYYSFALARERAAADHYQAVARLEQVIGASLVPEIEGQGAGGIAIEPPQATGGAP